MCILTGKYLLPALYMVLIGPAKGIETGMGISPDLPDLVDGNICWQFIVDPEEKTLICYFFGAAIKMRIEYPGMDPGVSSAATCNLNFLSKQEAEVFIQDLLDSPGIGLYLPAVVMGTPER